MGKLVDLLIVNHRTPEHLERLLDGLQGCQEFANIYVQDNGSRDIHSLKLLQERGDEFGLTKWYESENVGYAAAINKMASKSDSPFLAALNADVWMSPDDVHKTVSAFSQDSKIAVIGPKQRNETGHITHAGIFGTSRMPKHRAWKKLDKDDSLYRDVREAVTVSGAAYFMRRSIWDEMTSCLDYKRFTCGAIGAFLPTPHYYEETFYSYHVREHGYKVLYDGRVSIGHTWHASSKIGSSADKMFSTSQAIFRQACDEHGIERD